MKSISDPRATPSTPLPLTNTPAFLGTLVETEISEHFLLKYKFLLQILLFQSLWWGTVSPFALGPGEIVYSTIVLVR